MCYVHVLVPYHDTFLQGQQEEHCLPRPIPQQLLVFVQPAYILVVRQFRLLKVRPGPQGLIFQIAAAVFYRPDTFPSPDHQQPSTEGTEVAHLCVI